MEITCEWEWLGVQPWHKLADTCVSPTTCNPPAGDGTFFGQIVNVACSES